MRRAPAPALLALLFLLPLLVAPAMAEPGGRLITMTGEASASATPDLAILSAGMMTQARTAKEALESNNRIMTKALAALKEAGLAEKDITTSRLSVQPQIDYKTATPRVFGYQASHRLTIRLRDMSRLGEAIDRLTEAGVNGIDAISFEVDNWSGRLDEARKEAIADARRKASLMAEAAGAKLGKVVQIALDGAERPQPRLESVMRAAPAMASPTPVAAGEQTYRLQVSVTWELVD